MPILGRSRPASNYLVVNPTVFPGSGTTLTTPSVTLAAPALTPTVPATVALTTPNINLSAPAATMTAVQSFPFGVLDLECELYLNLSWTNVSTYAYQRDGSSPPIGVTRGKPNESSGTDPSTATWEWNNRDGRFSPKNPTSPYYGQLIRNTSVRWSTNAATNYLRLENQDGTDSAVAQSSNSAALAVTGPIEFRIQMRLEDWQPAFIAGRWDANLSWSIALEANGNVTFWWSTNGTLTFSAQSTAPLPFTKSPFALRVTFATSTGTATFYTASTIDGSYTQFGSAVSGTNGASTSLNAASGSSVLEVGWSNNWTTNGSYGSLHGRVYEARYYNGIGGTVVADAIFSAQSAGTTSWTDSHSISWTVANGAEISARDFRYHGQMSSQPPTWDKTGNDQSVQATAGGPLRLIGQGNSNVRSPMYRALTSQSGTNTLVSYWPMEDASGSSSFGPAAGSTQLLYSNAVPELASSEVFLASDALPQLNGAILNGTIGNYQGSPWNSTGTTWTVRFLADIQTLPGSGVTPLIIINCNGASDTVAWIVVYVQSSGDMQIVAYNLAGTALADSGAVIFPGGVLQPLWWSIEAQPSGGGTNYNLVSLVPGANTAFLTTINIASGNAGYAGGVIVNPDGFFTNTTFGHLSVQATWESLFTFGSALNAWQGEPAAQRFARLAKENGWNARIIGAPSVSAAMGPQGSGSFIDLITGCETADMGQMFETRQVLGLGYRTLASMLNQSPIIVVDYSQAMLGGAGESQDSGLSPTYDDLFTKNDWTVTRGSQNSQGGTYRYQLNDGSPLSVGVAGDYPNSVTINFNSDSQLPDAAGWLVHIGTVDLARWQQTSTNLARSALAAQVENLKLMDVGDISELVNIPTVISYDPIYQIKLAVNEDLGAFYWWVITNASPASPYSTGIYDDLVYGRCDTDGSMLNTSVNTTATSLSIATVTGFPLWTTAGGDFPFDIAVAGERMTVTNITGSSSPQTFTVTRSVNSVVKAQTAGADVRLWFPPVYAPI